MENTPTPEEPENDYAFWMEWLLKRYDRIMAEAVLREIIRADEQSNSPPTSDKIKRAA